MTRPKRMAGRPKYYNPEVESSKPQWAGPPLSHSPTPPRRPVVYMTGDHVVPNVGLGTTVVAPPGSAVAAGGSAVAAGTQPPIPPKVLGIVGLNTTAVGPPIPEVAPPIPQADVYLIDVSGSSAVAAGGSAVGTKTRPLKKVRKWTADVNTQTDQSVFPFVG